MPFLAKAFKNGTREKVYLATKFPSWLVGLRADMDKLLHNVVFDFLNDAVEAGKIRYAGFSFHDKLALFKEIVDAYDWDFCQIKYNYYDVHFQASMEGLKYAAGKYYGLLDESERASNCVQCGLCVEKCPQQIPIPEEMEHVAALFANR